MNPLRKCKICGLEAVIEQDLDNFVPNTKSKYDRLNFCKQCYPTHRLPISRKHYVNHKEEHRQYYLAHRDEHRARSKERWKRRKALGIASCTEKELVYARKYRAKTFMIRQARKQAWQVPIKPFCEKCGTTEVKLERHHPDYSKPLEVVTLCRLCHEKLHVEQFLAQATGNKTYVWIGSGET